MQKVNRNLRIADKPSASNWLDVFRESCVNLSVLKVVNESDVSGVDWDFPEALFLAVTVITTVGKPFESSFNDKSIHQFTLKTFVTQCQRLQVSLVSRPIEMTFDEWSW